MDPSEAYARFVLHQLTSDKIVELADAWLASGVYTDSLGELFAIKSPVMAEVGPLFLSAMKELGVNTPDRKAAARLLIHRGFTRVSEGCSDPVFEAEFLYWGVYHEMSNELINEKYLGDSLGLEPKF
jgi:hypothetical protein